jgi:transposase-like protein
MAPPDTGHLRCPFCGAYEVDRLYLASLRLDSCECRACGARWDEELGTGVYRERGSRAPTAPNPS